MPHAFALCPDDAPPRVIRYGTLPQRGMVAIYDAKQNLLLIDQADFDLLHGFDQELVLRTQEPVLFIQFVAGKCPTFITRLTHNG